MLEDKDIKKLIRAMEEVFPTAEMINKSFNAVATKEQFESLNMDVREMKKDVKEIKNSVGNHEQRISKLEHKTEFI